MKKIAALALSLVLTTYGLATSPFSVASAAPAERGANCAKVVNHYAPYDQFTVDASGTRFNGSNTWRTAIIASYKSCPRKVVGGKIGVEFRWISGRGTSNKCKSIRDFTADIGVLGFNPGPATTDCNGQTQRFVTWYPADPWVIRKSTSSGFKDISGSWSVDIANQRDQGSDYSRLYPRFR